MYFRSLPTEQVRFSFDSTLVEDTSGRLLANQLTIDNLTVEWVRTKMSDLEAKIKECHERQTSQPQDARWVMSSI